MESRQAVNRLIVSVDAEGSSRRDRRGKMQMRDAVYRLVHEALAAVQLPLDRVHLEDRGDGVLLATDPGTPPENMVGLWLEEVYQGLREHNHPGGGAGPENRLRLRIGMHAGPVTDDGRGLLGTAVDLACGLCNSDRARQVLTLADTSDLVFVASDWLYGAVIADGGRFIEPEHYRSCPVRVKDSEVTAWLYVPRLPEPPPAALDVPDPAPAAPAPAPAAGAAATPDSPGGPEEGAGPPGRPAHTTKYAMTVNGPNHIIDGATFESGSTAVSHGQTRSPRDAREGAAGGTDE